MTKKSIPRKKLTPEERKAAQEKLKQKRIEKKYKTDVQLIFVNAAFKSIKTAGTEFTFKGRTGEIDNLFVYKNIVIVCEDTFTQSPGSHLLGKKVLFDLIDNNSAGFIEFLKVTFPDFKLTFDSNAFQPFQYEVKIVYASRFPVSDEHTKQCQNVFFFDYPRFRYFLNLSKIIGGSSRYELFKFFGIEFKNIGSARLRGNLSHSGEGYQGFLLPEANSNYPTGYKVLSFYVDPETLLQKSYVLRKDSWQDPDCSYQRMLVPKKIRSMRKYLHETKRVYVNNLIVTLPSTTTFTSPNTRKQLTADELLENQHVQIHLPVEFNSIGLIDGQHRVYSYHEGNDAHESEICKFRKYQNLLITAIMYPDSATEPEKTKFEATLFLEINDEQTRAGGDLKQAIELIVRPFTTMAISKAVILELAKRGPLKGLLEEHYFDEDTKIKTSSIVSYGLKPLVKFSGNDSLMSIWDHPDKATLAKGTDKQLLRAYIDFCVDEINKLLVAFKINAGNELWLRENKETCVLNPTSINGFIVCLRELIKTNQVGDMESYKAKLSGIQGFGFKTYKSSHWKQLGLAIYNQFFKE